MLNFAKTTIAVVAVSALFAGNAQADVNADLANICTIVKADDKSELRKKMKLVQNNYKLKLQNYYDGISCGGQSLIRTAIQANAVEAGTLLVKKMPKSALGQPEADGKTLLDWANENGHSASEITQVVSSRI